MAYFEDGVGHGGQWSIVGEVSHLEDVEAPVVEVHHKLKIIEFLKTGDNFEKLTNTSNRASNNTILL
jgi:hypothetical protein